ncbi:uncharacterized protein B0H18DRAFT_988270 [Fomitopsis serialis]|uniref:uncharacterized protein n=1 Tax=Fomitopsis serialis TaxID=139415 RepID=UPI002007267A|nr:uncharacterized protein B0H18DRAFT_988270 [Neoantrodia serialis]KAH9931824.1 hypothetical protein B0H18DRAFT_988270 [Neoantrodia serialis]
MEANYLNTAEGADILALPVGDLHIDTPLEEYGLNFCWPVKPLEGSGVRSELRRAAKHPRQGSALLKDDPDQTSIYRYESRVFPATLTDLLTRAEESWRRRSDQYVFAILDLSRPYVEGRPCGGRIAGIIGLRATSAPDFVGESGHVVVLPRAQRTHVMTNALCLLLKYCFTPRTQGGLELRRMEWIATAANDASSAVPRRLGYACDGIRRWRGVVTNPRSATQRKW